MPKPEPEDGDIIEAGLGHNSLSPANLRSFCERLEKLNQDKKDIAEDIKQVLEEADHQGFDKKTIKEMVKIRAMDKDDRDEQFALRDAYLEALGLL